MSEISEWADVWEPIQSLAKLSQDTFPRRTSSIKYHNQTVPIDTKLQRQKNVIGLRGLCGPNARFSQGTRVTSFTVHTPQYRRHCSISAPSLCTQKYIRQYFLRGTLPEPETVYGVNESPFALNGVVGDTHARGFLSIATF
ncbi:hypothetical protein DFH08DRAFT_812510 [Mycena albidolilacea]|uniref:Uncharacterized protein n=1 Tax=Mycena albidolilacea TaxID=1033008 RepID=A0AAD7ENT9_9AGAR|nr:hypothetical protein DFH08DRAFT_812510 [Mycena albidolilacea]